MNSDEVHGFPTRWQEALDFTQHTCREMGVDTDSPFALALLIFLLPAPGENPYLSYDYVLRVLEAMQSTLPPEPHAE
jgi:hypothetical protein